MFYCSSDVFAQSGQILIATRDTVQYKRMDIGTLLNALRPHHKGPIDVSIGLFPDSLEKYDAIFTDLRFSDQDDSVLISSELQKLRKYLLSVGKLYIEVSQMPFPQISHFHRDTTLTDLIGVNSWVGLQRVVKSVSLVTGINGRFTEALSVPRNTDPTEENALEELRPAGSVHSVLEAHGNPQVSIAWIHDSSIQKIVWHWPIVKEHYDLFLGMVACNYFGLCDTLGVNASAEIATPSTSFTTETREILCSYFDMTPKTISLYNLVGSKVFEIIVNDNAFRLPISVKNGCYIMRATGNTVTVEKKILVY